MIEKEKIELLKDIVELQSEIIKLKDFIIDQKTQKGDLDVEKNYDHFIRLFNHGSYTRGN